MGWDRTIDSCRVGEQAYCCKTTAHTVYKRSDPIEQMYKASLQKYLDNPTCPEDDVEKAKLRRRQIDNVPSMGTPTKSKKQNLYD
jgi:hypothetical protein